MRICSLHADAGGQLRTNSGIQTEFAGAGRWSGADGEGQSAAFRENAGRLCGGRARQEKRHGSALRDDAGNRHVPAGEARPSGVGVCRFQSRLIFQNQKQTPSGAEPLPQAAEDRLRVGMTGESARMETGAQP